MELTALAPLLIANVAVFAPAAALVATGRRRPIVAWFAFGVVLGPIAVALVWFAPPRRCAACDSPTVGWASQCRACAANVRSGARESPAAPSDSGAARAPRVPRRRAGVEPARAARATRQGGRESRRKDMATPVAVGPGRPRRSRGPEGQGHEAEREAPRLEAGGTLVYAAQSGAPGDPVDESAALAVAATAVYVGGSVGLEIGHRYTIARDASDLVIVGPVETSPRQIAHRRELATIDPVGVDDRLVITGVGASRGKYLLRFQAVAGMSSDAIEKHLTLAPGPFVGSAADAAGSGA